MALFEEWPICMCDLQLNDDVAFAVKFISFRPFFFFWVTILYYSYSIKKKKASTRANFLFFSD